MSLCLWGLRAAGAATGSGASTKRRSHAQGVNMRRVRFLYVLWRKTVQGRERRATLLFYPFIIYNIKAQSLSSKEQENLWLTNSIHIHCGGTPPLCTWTHLYRSVHHLSIQSRCKDAKDYMWIPERAGQCSTCPQHRDTHNHTPTHRAGGKDSGPRALRLMLVPALAVPQSLTQILSVPH